MKNYLWRFVTPYSTKWSKIDGLYGYMTYKVHYIFGIRVAVIQTNDPAGGQR